MINTKEIQALDSAHYMHPFTAHGELAEKGARVMVKGEGIYLWDSEGKMLLDGMSGLWCINVGYGRKELADAAYKQLLELPYYNSFFNTTTIPPVQLAKLLAEVTPPQFRHVFYAGSGSEGNDTIFRMVRWFWVGINFFTISKYIVTLFEIP